MPLSLALIQIFRDEGLFQKQKSFNKEDRNFNLAFSSEAAKLTVQKQAEFGEKYLELFDEFLEFLYKQGPDSRFLEFANKLTKLRRKYALWIEEEVYLSLSEIELSIRKIGADERHLVHLPIGEKRKKLIEKISSQFKEIYKKNGKDEKYRDEIVEKLSGMIGVNQVITSKKRF
jgi:Asp-tRNA(Asn)/Glu-tRNA(Gln) amidotransferase B subunit